MEALDALYIAMKKCVPFFHRDGHGKNNKKTLFNTKTHSNILM